MNEDESGEIRRVLDEIGNPPIPEELLPRLRKSVHAKSASLDRRPWLARFFEDSLNLKVLVPVAVCAFMVVAVVQGPRVQNEAMQSEAYEISDDELNELAQSLGVTSMVLDDSDIDFQQDELENFIMEIS